MKIQEQIKSSKIELWKTSDLLPYARNSRTHSESQIAQVAASIKEFGFTSPILIKQSGEIIAGHCRLEASRKLKLDFVPCIVLSHLTDIQARALIIADNQLALNAGWNEEMLKLEIEELDDADFDLDLLGFDDNFLDDLGIEDDDKPQGEPDAVPDVPKNVHNVQRGQVWQLGAHRLMCGDSTSEADVAKLMDGKKADMVFTDPPYGVSFVGRKATMRNSSTGKVLGKEDYTEIKNDNLRNDDLEHFFSKSLSNALNHSIDSSPYYIFFAINRSIEVLTALNNIGLNIRNWLIWYKGKTEGGHVMGAQYKPCFEAFLYCHKKDNSPSWCGDHVQRTVWEEGLERLGLHPTTKPISLIEKAIGNHPAKTVLDLFGGSGSTLIACEKTNRANFSMELDEHYCSVIIERWQTYTGQKAVLLEPLKSEVDEPLSL